MKITDGIIEMINNHITEKNIIELEKVIVAIPNHSNNELKNLLLTIDNQLIKDLINLFFKAEILEKDDFKAYIDTVYKEFLIVLLSDILCLPHKSVIVDYISDSKVKDSFTKIIK